MPPAEVESLRDSEHPLAIVPQGLGILPKNYRRRRPAAPKLAKLPREKSGQVDSLGTPAFANLQYRSAAGWDDSTALPAFATSLAITRWTACGTLTNLVESFASCNQSASSVRNPPESKRTRKLDYPQAIDGP